MSKKLIVVNNETEIFTKSTCNCDFCIQTHKDVENWDKLVPETTLQKNMKTVIAKIEFREKKRKNRD